MSDLRLDSLAGPAEAVGALLTAKKHSVCVVEATSGGLTSACLQAVPGASRFFIGSVIVYSVKAAKALVPQASRQQLGRSSDPYANPTNYIQSKQVFVTSMAKYVRESMGAEWAVAESGATSMTTMMPVLRPAGIFTCIAVIGPCGSVRRSELFRLPEKTSREESMRKFAKRSLEVLEDAVRCYEDEIKAERTGTQHNTSRL